MINKWKFERSRKKQTPPPEARAGGRGHRGRSPHKTVLRSLVFSSICGFVPSKNAFYHVLYSFQIFTITVFASFLQGHGLSRGLWHRQSSGIYRNDCLGGFHQDSGRCPARKHRWTSMFFESSRPLSSFPALASFLSPSPPRLLSLFSASPPTAPSVPFPHRCF